MKRNTNIKNMVLQSLPDIPNWQSGICPTSCLVELYLKMDILNISNHVRIFATNLLSIVINYRHLLACLGN